MTENSVTNPSPSRSSEQETASRPAADSWSWAERSDKLNDQAICNLETVHKCFLDSSARMFSEQFNFTAQRIVSNLRLAGTLSLTTDPSEFFQTLNTHARATLDEYQTQANRHLELLNACVSNSVEMTEEIGQNATKAAQELEKVVEEVAEARKVARKPARKVAKAASPVKPAQDNKPNIRLVS